MSEKKVTPQVLTTYTEGAILCDSWGYEQTNYDFYCVLTRKGDWVTIQKLKRNRRDYNPQTMVSKEMPGEIDENEKPLRKMIKKRDGKEIGFSLRNCSGGGWTSLWDGNVKHATHYA